MFFKSRLAVAAVLMTVLFGVLLWRVFYLQIVKGEKYQDNYTLKIVKERTLNSTRGNIYDRNGELLAYNELAYSITIEDNGSYSSTDKKNESLNAEIAQVSLHWRKTAMRSPMILRLTAPERVPTNSMSQVPR